MSKKTLYRCTALIDGTGNNPIEDAGLLVEDNKIVRVDLFKDFTLSKDIEIVDFRNKYIMPGLINCHVHVIMEPLADNRNTLYDSDIKHAMRGIRNLKKHLKSGVTFLRDLGAYKFIDVELKKLLSEGFIEGPGYLISGHHICMTGGHGWIIGREADGADEVRKATREQLKAGADIIKLTATGGIGTPGVEPGSPQLTIEEMKAAVDEAHKAGNKVASHAQGLIGIKNSIIAGVDSIEHGIFLDDEAIEMMLEKGTYLVPTLAAVYCYTKNGVEAGISAFAVEKAKRVEESHIKSFQKARKAGVKIAMGTDSGTPLCMHDKSALELKLMVDAGMSPMEAIVASTKTAAELLNIEKQYGTIEKDKIADFIVLNENPINNIETLLNVNKVYKNGKIVN